MIEEGDLVAQENKPNQQHYLNAEKRLGTEPINVVESVHETLLETGANPQAALNVALATKYILRAGLKESFKSDINKAITYLTRAKKGEW